MDHTIRSNRVKNGKIINEKENNMPGYVKQPKKIEHGKEMHKEWERESEGESPIRKE